MKLTDHNRVAAIAYLIAWNAIRDAADDLTTHTNELDDEDSAFAMAHQAEVEDAVRDLGWRLT